MNGIINFMFKRWEDDDDYKKNIQKKVFSIHQQMKPNKKSTKTEFYNKVYFFSGFIFQFPRLILSSMVELII